MPALPNVYSYYPKHIFESSIPINSLTYKCLAKLATIESLSTGFPLKSEVKLASPPSVTVSPSETLHTTTSATTTTTTTITTTINDTTTTPTGASPASPLPSTSNFPSSSSPSSSSSLPHSPFSSCLPTPLSSSTVTQSSSSNHDYNDDENNTDDDDEDDDNDDNDDSLSPSQAIPANPLGDFQNTPIIIRQYIVDYVTRERLQISCQYLCDLLSDGGCYSIDLWELSSFNQFGEAEMMKIFSTMNQNCYNLRQLTLGGPTWIYKSRVVNGPMRNLFKENTLVKLRCLKLQQTSSPEELITIFSSCPNLVRLEIIQPSLTDKQVTTVYRELQQTEYNKVRNSLRDLRLPSSVHVAGLIKMINLFPNLVFLNCCHYEGVLEAIKSEMMTKQIYGDYDILQLQQAANILENLRGLTVTRPMGRDAVNSLVTLSPNLQELVLEISAHMLLFPIAELKYLARLALYNSQSSPASFLQQVLPLLQQTGDNLQALDLEGFDVVDLATCARYCPNLKHFSGGWFTILSFTQATTGLTISKQERANLRRPFSHLQTLRLRPRTRHNVGVKAIVYILTNAINIESIELYSCPDLTDEQLIGLIKNNSLRNLRSLILRHGHFLSKSCLNQLVHSLDNLSFLDCGAPLLSKAELN